MTKDNFRSSFLNYFDEIKKRVMSETGDWTVKGFIDIHQNIYTISLDTKVLSKVLELLLFPVIIKFADEHHCDVVLAPAQNQYPDITLISKFDKTQCFALDIKTTYRTGQDKDGNMRISGMTLGTFGGYFRTRNKPVSSTFAYDRYLRHYVLGVVYSRVSNVDERQVYSINNLADIPSVATNFEFFLQEKYRIASDKPGSGNTRNIGSTKLLNNLLDGTGIFSKLGIEIFDDYWIHYRNREMAKSDGLDKQPYRNLKEYKLWKSRGAKILSVPDDDLESNDN